MAAGDSITGICNLALGLLGQPGIVTLTDNSKAARYCALFWNNTRQRVIREYLWNFAKADYQPVLAPVQPTFQWTYAYQLPANTLRVWNMPEADTDPWEIKGGALYSNEDSPQVVVIVDVTDPTLFDAMFVKVLAMELALDLAVPLGAEVREATQMIAQRLAGFKAQAVLVNALENSPTEWDEDVWLRNRY